MSLFSQIEAYIPFNAQEACDKARMLRFMRENEDYLERKNQTAHFTASVWTLNQAHTKTLMVYHNIYDSWSWVGGHADGVEDLKEVALRELREETGVSKAKLLSEDIFSLETLAVNGHWKKGIYVPSHLHFNLTYLAVADEEEALCVNREENQAVQWFAIEDIPKISKEPWMIEFIYKKLVDKSLGISIL